MQIKINLKNRPTGKINVDLQWNIRVTEPKSGFLPRLLRQSNRVERRVRLNIRDIKVPKELVCDKNDLFAVLYDGKEYRQAEFPVDMTIESMSTPFQLLFNQHHITDCTRTQDANPRSYTIDFTVELLEEKKDTVIDSHSDKIEIALDPLEIAPRITPVLNEDEIQYSSSLKRENVGEIGAWIAEEFSYTPSQECRMSLKLFRDDKEVPGLLSFEDGTAACAFTLKPGKKNVQKLPIFIDFTTIANPVTEKEKYRIETTVYTSPSYSPNKRDSKVITTPFTLRKDLQGTELCVFTCSAGSQEKQYHPNTSVVSDTLRFIPGTPITTNIAVKLANIATDDTNPKAGLTICNMTLTEEVLNNVSVQYGGTKRNHVLTSVDGRDLDAMKTAKGLFIPNGHNAFTMLKAVFNPTSIRNIYNAADPTSYDLQVRSVLTFDYYEDADGTQDFSTDNRKEGKVSILWKMHLEPNAQWLCVDYGSSAIVCQYDNAIINLRERKNLIFREAESGTFKRDELEKGTPFLSSDIVLHDVKDALGSQRINITKGANTASVQTSSLCSQLDPTVGSEPKEYLNMSVCLSPTSSLIKDEVHHQLPCLKILMGNELLPEKPDFATFRYTRIKDGQLGTIEAMQAHDADEETALMRINSIFRESYSSLFRFFISPELQGRAVNKLVLTYPNTYSPANLRTLEKIARQTFPQVREGYLRFVSESDAVAAYYVRNWDMLNEGHKSIKFDDDENILIFDMGAGTLDLTLFNKRKDKDGKYIVEILGKIGTGKAGNYLDFLIAEILKESLPALPLMETTVSTARESDNTTRAQRLSLKDAIKQTVKPALTPGSQITVNGVTFDADLILTHRKFEEYLRQITAALISRLMERAGKKLKIDAVILSGRSCRLIPLQARLREALKPFAATGFRLIKKLLEGETVRRPDGTTFTDHDLEKTVVVKGAKVLVDNFATAESPVRIRSKRFYASYGIAYQALGGRYVYRELLDCTRLESLENGVRLEDFCTEPLEITDLGGAEKILLVQTYLPVDETAASIHRLDYEFVSIMEEFPMAVFNNSAHLTLSLNVDYRNRISLRSGNLEAVGNTPLGTDLMGEITKRSIWPVTI